MGRKTTIDVSEKPHIMQLKDRFPREWTIFCELDHDGDAAFTKLDIEAMCKAHGIDKDVGEALTECLHLSDKDDSLDFEEFLPHFAEIAGVRRLAREHHWKRCMGVGVAGNVAGHMEMAGEATKKTDAEKAAEAEKAKGEKPTPTGLFCFYLPQHKDTLQDIATVKKAWEAHDTQDHNAPQSFNDRDFAGELKDEQIEMPSATPSPSAKAHAARGPGSASSDASDAPSRRLSNASADFFSGIIDKLNHKTKNPKLADKLKRLERFPVTNSMIIYPANVIDSSDEGSDEGPKDPSLKDLSGTKPKVHNPEKHRVQVEPEVAIYCDILYDSSDNTGGDTQFGDSKPTSDKDGKPPRKVLVDQLVPRKIAAFNDCSMRKLEGSTKLSERKNWGFGSKGISLNTFKIDRFDDDQEKSIAARLILASYVSRENPETKKREIHEYTKSAPARNYLSWVLQYIKKISYYDDLLQWIKLKLNYQEEHGNWEDMNSLMEVSDYPMSCWICLGAGEYTDWGMKNFLLPRDECLVLLYDEKVLPKGPDAKHIETLFGDHAPDTPGMIHLHQTFV